MIGLMFAPGVQPYAGAGAGASTASADADASTAASPSVSNWTVRTAARCPAGANALAAGRSARARTRVERIGMVEC